MILVKSNMDSNDNQHMPDELTNQILFGKPGYLPTKQPLNEEENTLESIGKPTYFCVGIVDIVDSTKIIARLSPNQSSKYYTIFLNEMAKVVAQYNGQVLKTMGDSLLFYFPETRFDERKFGFLSCIECGFSMINLHEKLKMILSQEMLPSIDFRISIDYGIVTMMKSKQFPIDLVGPTINTCAKINGLCQENSMVIGSDLYEKIKSFKEYKFGNNGSFSIDLKHPYPVFSVCRKD